MGPMVSGKSNGLRDGAHRAGTLGTQDLEGHEGRPKRDPRHPTSVVRDLGDRAGHVGSVAVIVVGRRGAAYAARRRWNLVQEFSDLPPQPRLLDVSAITRSVINGFIGGEFDEVYLGFTRFVTTLSQQPQIRRLLPLRTSGVNNGAKVVVDDPPEPTRIVGEYLYEPDPQVILDSVLPRFTEIQIYQAILEALASEHSARMVAMRAATDSANELLGSLTLTYNQERQNSITREMLEIAGGVEAMRRVR